MLERLGARLVSIDLGDIATAHADGYLILMAELASLQEPDLDRIEDFDAGARARIEQGLTFSATAYLRALRRRPLVLAAACLPRWQRWTCWSRPGVGCEAATLADMTVEVNATRASAATGAAAQHHDLRLHWAAGAHAALREPDATACRSRSRSSASPTTTRCA